MMKTRPHVTVPATPIAIHHRETALLPLKLLQRSITVSSGNRLEFFTRAPPTRILFVMIFEERDWDTHSSVSMDESKDESYSCRDAMKKVKLEKVSFRRRGRAPQRVLTFS